MAAAALLPILTMAMACGGGDEPRGRTSHREAVSNEPAEETEVAGKIPATDSAAAATAMATGHKTEAGNVCWKAGDAPDGRLENLGELYDAAGWAVGVVSTVPFDHATSACFVAHNPDRNHYYEGYEGRRGPGISEEMIEEGLADLIVGSGHPAWENPEWSTSEGHISREEYARLADGRTRYVMVERREGVDGAEALADAVEGLDPDEGEAVFGLFGGPDGCFEPPLPSNDGSALVTPATEENPTLAEASVAALDYLSRDDQGFFLMVEQGDIDWANHNNNYHWMIGTMWDLEMAVRAVESYLDSSRAVGLENTLVIVTSDHSNSYMRLAMNNPLGRGVLPAMEGEAPNHTYPNAQVTWACTEHTNELVTLAAAGPDEALQALRELEGRPPAPPEEGLIDNTHIHTVLAGCCAPDSPVRNVILIVGDGMNLAHERAAGIYLYGDVGSMAWQDGEAFPYQVFCTTWDIDTYNRYAAAAGARPYDPEEFDPIIGYDPDRGGSRPLEGNRDYFLEPLPAGPSAAI